MFDDVVELGLGTGRIITTLAAGWSVQQPDR
jgi:hypothetical protein